MKVGTAIEDPRAMEDNKVSAAIRTDFILSAEITAIALATIPEAGFWSQAVTLVGIGIAILVYGAVALIVKADDVRGTCRPSHPVAGITGRAPSALDHALALLTQRLGRGLMLGCRPS